MKARKLFCIFAALALSLEAAGKMEDFQPDFAGWDIYLPHLKRTYISGWWKVRKVSSDRKNDPADEGTRLNYEQVGLDDSGWGRDLVPNNLHSPFLSAAATREEKTWGGVAWFRKDFTGPQLKAGERAVLRFDDVLGHFKLWVNGTLVADDADYVMPTEHGGYRGPAEPRSYDVTALLRPGQRNVVALRLFHSGEPVLWEVWSPICGIMGKVYIDVKPAAWAERILVTPEQNLQDIAFECRLAGTEDPGAAASWRAEVFEWESAKVVATAELGAPYVREGSRYVAGRTAVRQAVPWSPEHPFLYGIKLFNRRGEVTGVQRFGMRTFRVKGGNFELNGRPVMLRGICRGNEYPYSRHGFSFALISNEGNAARKYWQAYKDMNVNHIRVHSSEYPESTYDIFDELGFIVTDELDYPVVHLKDAVRADEIDVKGFDGACDKDGALLPQFAGRISRRIERRYSHPSVCTFSFGNELRDYSKRATSMLNSLYDLYHRLDRQGRPVTSSSGRFWKDGSNVEELCAVEKMDYADTHDYTGSINNMPVAYCEPVASHFVKLLKKHFPGGQVPVVNGETVYFSPHYYGWITDGVWAAEQNRSPDWTKALYVLNDWHTKDRGTAFLALYWIRNWGIKNYKYHRNLGRGVYTDLILEAQRKLWPEMDGYEALSEPFFSVPESAWPFAGLKFTPNEAWRWLQRVCAPQIVILDYVAPNRFTGEKVATTAYVINNGEKAVEDVQLEISFEQDGQPIGRKFIQKIGTVQGNEKKALPVEFSLPEREGEYSLVCRLYSMRPSAAPVELNFRERNLNLRSRAEVFAQVKTAKKVALFDTTAAVFGSLKPFSTTKLMKAFGVPFTPVAGFTNLDQYDVLVIGNGSVDSSDDTGAGFIRSFVENGGRLLVFEQTVTGRIPFLNELEYSLAGPGQFSEILQFDHPALKGLTQRDFFCWNQGDWSVYRHYIRPVSEAALTTGGDTTQWGSDNFGMVSAHLRLGQGDVLITQAEVTSTFRNDSGAALFSRRLLETVLDDATRKDAAPFRGYGAGVMIKGVAGEKAHFISLREAANMGFADDKARDGKGGWTDQGAVNDLAPFPVGRQVFRGVPFQILDPGKNDGRSCVVVSANSELKFQAESKAVAVGVKAGRLLFMHSAAWTSSGGHLGDYEVRYASGRKEIIPIVDGDNVGDWWEVNRKLKNAVCGWSGTNRSGTVGVFLFSWNNPHPDEEIASVVLRIRGKAAVGLVGLTAEKP